MLGPIATQLHLKECAHLLFALGLKNAVHHSESALDKLRQHGDAPIGEILRTNAEQFPRFLLHGSELEFVGEEGVFGAELVVVAVHSRLLGIEHTSLTEKQCLDLQHRIAVLAKQAKRSATSQPLKRVVVDAETEVTGERHIAHIFPTAVEAVEQLVNALHLSVQPLKRQTLHPFHDGEVWHLLDFCGARHLDGGTHERGIVGIELWRHLQHQLRNQLAIGAAHRRIVLRHHMQNHAIVSLVAVVVMTLPVGGAVVHFHVAHPHVAVNLDFRVEEIGASVGVEQSGIHHPHLFPGVGDHILRPPQAMLPHILH